MPREPKHASNRQAEEIDADMIDMPLSKRQAAIDGVAPSRNELKKHMQDLQELGEAVSALPPDRLDKLKIDERLRDAIDELRRTKSFEGKRRQVQYIGKLMKHEDPEPLREAVASYRVGSATDTLALHQAEYWRDQLLATASPSSCRSCICFLSSLRLGAEPSMAAWRLLTGRSD